MPVATINKPNAKYVGDHEIVIDPEPDTDGPDVPPKYTLTGDNEPMNKVTFVYGTMNCGKSAEILRLIHEYHEQGKNILVVKPSKAARESEDRIVTRSGESYPADVIETPDAWGGEFEAEVAGKIKDLDHLDMVVADEAQFLETKHIVQLVDIIGKHFPKTPIMLFGLLKNFRNELFETSKFLVEFADDLRELKAVCWFCNHKATCNLRLRDGQPIYDGKELSIGGNNEYKSVCRYHYKHPQLGGSLNYAD